MLDLELLEVRLGVNQYPVVVVLVQRGREAQDLEHTCDDRGQKRVTEPTLDAVMEPTRFRIVGSPPEVHVLRPGPGSLAHRLVRFLSQIHVSRTLSSIWPSPFWQRRWPSFPLGIGKLWPNGRFRVGHAGNGTGRSRRDSAAGPKRAPLPRAVLCRLHRARLCAV